jgi:hypothetical protein
MIKKIRLVQAWADSFWQAATLQTRTAAEKDLCRRSIDPVLVPAVQFIWAGSLRGEGA